MINVNGSDFSYERVEHVYKAYVKDISLTIKVTVHKDQNWSWEVYVVNDTVNDIGLALPPNVITANCPAITKSRAVEWNYANQGNSAFKRLTFTGQCWYHLRNKPNKTYFPDDIVRFLCHGWETF